MEPQQPSSQSHASFPIIAVAIIGIFATIFLLVFYYIFVIKCCLNWHRIDILRRFNLSRNTNTHHHHSLYVSTTPEPKGLDESVIRSIPVFHYQKQPDSDNECAVCLGEFQHYEKLRRIPNCGHLFHIDCIDVWLQNNPNCPLCRNSISISISIPSHFPLPQENPPLQVVRNEQDYVVIELSNNNNNGVNETRNIDGDVDSRRNLSHESRKRTKKLMKKYGHNVTSMGDECIDVNGRRKGSGDEQFLVQPIRRSFSMDSALDRQLLLAVQEIVQRNSMNNNVDVTKVNDGCSSSSSNNRVIGRGFFSFGHARSAILPLHLTP